MCAHATGAATCAAAADNLCAAYHKGPLCQVCTKGYYKPNRGSLCTSCSDASSVASYSTAAGLAFVVIASLLGCAYVRRLRRIRQATADQKAKKPKQARKSVRQVLWRRLQSESLRNKGKLVIALFQVVRARFLQPTPPRPASTTSPPAGGLVRPQLQWSAN
jgi:hypothetical protein